MPQESKWALVDGSSPAAPARIIHGISRLSNSVFAFFEKNL
jgi:hypothetical protein